MGHGACPLGHNRPEVRRALAELGALHAKGKLQRTMTVRDALEEFAPRCREPNAQALLKSLLEG